MIRQTRRLTAIVALAALLVPFGESEATADGGSSGSASAAVDSLHGHVIFTLRINDDYILQPGDRIGRVRFSAIGDTDRDPIWISSMDGAVDTGRRLFVADLPVGSYRISGFELYAEQTNRRADGVGALQINEKLGQFSVSGNSLTNLGTLVIQPRLYGRSRVAGISRVPPQEEIPDLFQALTGIDELDDIRGWDEAVPEGMQGNLELFVLRSPLAQPLQILADGSLIGGTRLGGVHVRDAEGEWRLEFLPELASVDSITENGDGWLILSSDSDHLYARHRTAEAWTKVEMPKGYHRPIIGSIDDSTLYVLAEYREYSAVSHSQSNSWRLPRPRRVLHLLATDWPMASEWDLLMEREVGRSESITATPGATDHDIYLNIDDNTYQLDLRSGRFHRQRQLTRVRTAGYMQWALYGSSEETVVRRRGQEEWHELEGFIASATPVFMDDAELLVYGRPQQGSTRRFPGIYQASLDGNEFQHLLDPPMDCDSVNQLLYHAETIILRCDFDRIYSTDITDLEWKLEKGSLAVTEDDDLDEDWVM